MNWKLKTQLKKNFGKKKFRAWRKNILTGRRGPILFCKIPEPIHTCRGVQDKHFKPSSGILEDGFHTNICVHKVHFCSFWRAPRPITRPRKVIDTWNKKKKASPYSSYYSCMFESRKNADKNFDFFCVFSAAKKNTKSFFKNKKDNFGYNKTSRWTFLAAGHYSSMLLGRDRNVTE